MRSIVTEVRKCGKRGYANAHAACMALRECRSRGRCEIRYYQCPECTTWHLTSLPLLKAA